MEILIAHYGPEQTHKWIGLPDDYTVPHQCCSVSTGAGPAKENCLKHNTTEETSWALVTKSFKLGSQKLSSPFEEALVLSRESCTP